MDWIWTVKSFGQLEWATAALDHQGSGYVGIGDCRWPWAEYSWSKSPTLFWTSITQSAKTKILNMYVVCCDAYIPVAKISILVGSWNLVCVSGIYQFSYLQLLSSHILRRHLPNKCVTIQLQEARTLRSPDQAQQVRATKIAMEQCLRHTFIIVS